ncbi:MAG: bifunctional adenosylcobinamide kinase/adenosylcobinamide-phosphate guanylyltransferase [Bacteroidetes bacterium]|nr:bifunctional adenosylcobinamide kinase/adenosylcobinamide-phosphate guanylyltransferase [Bacteroidota bacterium]
MIILITGGERSGKSSYAQKSALSLSENPVYVATARKWDGDFKKRIERHQSERDNRWTSIEEEKYISKPELADKVVVIDCVTLWLTNFYADTKYNVEESLVQAKAEFEKIKLLKGIFIFITNEIGMGVHAETEIGRKFVELQGWMNQYIAQNAEEVFLMISGIPVKIKPLK